MDNQSKMDKINEDYNKLYQLINEYSNRLPDPKGKLGGRIADENVLFTRSNIADKHLSTMWLDKVANYEPRLMEEAKLRNQVLYQLMDCCSNRLMIEPFDKEPTESIDLMQLYVI